MYLKEEGEEFWSNYWNIPCMTHDKISLPCAYLGLCLCLFSIQLNDCKTPNASRRLKTEGISLLNPPSSPNGSHSSLGAPSWTHFGFDSTFPAPLGSSHGQDDDHRHGHGNALAFFFFCLVHQTPENGSWQFWKGSDYWFVVREAREGRSVQPSKAQAAWEKSDQEQEVDLYSKQLFCSHQKPTEPEEALSPSCQRKVVLLLWKHSLVRTVASHPSIVLGREMHFQQKFPNNTIPYSLWTAPQNKDTSIFWFA